MLITRMAVRPGSQGEGTGRSEAHLQGTSDEQGPNDSERHEHVRVDVQRGQVVGQIHGGRHAGQDVDRCNGGIAEAVCQALSQPGRARLPVAYCRHREEQGDRDGAVDALAQDLRKLKEPCMPAFVAANIGPECDEPQRSMASALGRLDCTTLSAAGTDAAAAETCADDPSCHIASARLQLQKLGHSTPVDVCADSSVATEIGRLTCKPRSAVVRQHWHPSRGRGDDVHALPPSHRPRDDHHDHRSRWRRCPGSAALQAARTPQILRAG